MQELESNGTQVINSGYGIENCTREKMTRLLLSNHVPHPESLIVKTDSIALDFPLIEEGVWIKRGDFQPMQSSDVSFTRNADEAKAVLNEYASRGIETAVINKHLRGDLVKFYGVSGSDFFHWFYPTACGYSKFGLEEINGKPRNIPFDEQQLKHICNQASKALNVRVYGGDCVICEHDKSIKIIDFNDWPSFAPCRDEAAQHIASAIHSAIVQYRATPIAAI